MDGVNCSGLRGFERWTFEDFCSHPSCRRTQEAGSRIQKQQGQRAKASICSTVLTESERGGSLNQILLLDWRSHPPPHFKKCVAHSNSGKPSGGGSQSRHEGLSSLISLSTRSCNEHWAQAPLTVRMRRSTASRQPGPQGLGVPLAAASGALSPVKAASCQHITFAVAAEYALYSSPLLSRGAQS